MKISEILYKAAEGPLGRSMYNPLGSVRIAIDHASRDEEWDYNLSCKAAGYYATLYDVRAWYNPADEFNEDHIRLALTMAATIAEYEGL